MGKLLLDAARDWARERGATHLELDSAEARKDAHRFYEGEGPTWRSVCFAWNLYTRLEEGGGSGSNGPRMKAVLRYIASNRD